ncbi:NYN domain-containing protein (plasmid) [Methylorubrum populi]
MRTIVYVDGFNFYHLRLQRQRQYRWLNLKAMADQLLKPPHVVTQVNYYTARVSSKIDAQAPAKQQAYLAALATVPEIQTHYGRFLFGEKWAFLMQPPAAKPPTYIWNLPGPRMVQVAKVEEKGSDVNLAAHLVRDAYLNRFDVALVLSNDTDLVEPVRIVTKEVGKQVGLIAPCRQRHGGPPIPSPSLRAVGSFVLYVDDRHLAAAQFPDPVVRAKGNPVIKPAGWV